MTKTAGVVFTFARPDYLEPVLDSILENSEWEKSDWFVYQDGLKDHPTIKDNYSKISQDDLEKTRYIIKDYPIWTSYVRNRENRGINYQLNEAFKLFEEGYDTLFVFEDDLILSKNYLRLLRISSEQNPNMINTLYSTNPERAKTDDELELMNWSPGYRYWGFHITREAYENIKPAWEAEYRHDKRAPFYDAILSRAARQFTKGKYCTKFNRAYNIGKEGILSYNEKNWVTRGIARQNHDIEYDFDSELENFNVNWKR